MIVTDLIEQVREIYPDRAERISASWGTPYCVPYLEALRLHRGECLYQDAVDDLLSLHRAVFPEMEFERETYDARAAA